MKKIIKNMGLLLLVSFALVGCGLTDDEVDNDGDYQDIEEESTESVEDDVESFETIQVVATFSIIADMIEQVGGDFVEVRTIVPIGDNPEDHEVLPSDIMAVTNADITFYNGLQLETEENWFEDMMVAAEQVAGVDFFAVADGIEDFGIEILYLQTEGRLYYPDPHVWLDLRGGIAYIKNIQNILSDFAPDHADVFAENADVYIQKLQALHEDWEQRFAGLADDVRIMVTSEGAFAYFANAYGLVNEFIWEINAEDEGTPEQIMRLVGILNNSNVNYLFTETSTESHYMEQISAEVGIPIFGSLFSDSLSEADGTGATYYKMMRYNLEMVYTALSD